MSDIGFDLNINNGQSYKKTLSDIERILDRLDRQGNKAGQIFDQFNESLRSAGFGARVFAAGLDKSSEGLQKIYEGIRGITPQFKAFVQALEEGFKSGDLKDVFGEEGQQAAEEFLGELKTTWGIASPSRVMMQYAGQLGAGFEQGTRSLDLGGQGQRIAKDFTQNFGSALLNGVKAATVGLVQTVGQSIKAVGDTIRQNAANLGQQGASLIQSGLRDIITGGIAGAIQGQFVTRVADFDQILNQVKVFGDLTKEQLAEVEKGIQDFAARTIFDPSQSANALLDLQKAGLAAADGLKVLNDAGDLATAQNVSLANTSKYVIQAVTAFGLSYDDSTKIVNAFNQAANASVASVDDLGQGLGNVGPIAKQFGLSLEQTLAILAMFNNAGITGAEAGTQLKSMLHNLTRPTKETVEAFRELGVSLSDAQGNIKPLNQILNELGHAMNDTRKITVRVGGLTAEQSKELEIAQKAYASATRQITLYNDGLSRSALNTKTSGKALADYQQIQSNAAAVIQRLTGDQSKAQAITKEITRTQIENLRVLQQLGGSFGSSGLSILLSQDENAIENFVTAMGGLPTAADIAQQQMATFKGAVESLRGSLETLGIKAIRPLLVNFLRPFIIGLTGIVNAITDLPEPFLAAVASIAGFATALVTLGGIVKLLTGTLAVLASGPLAAFGGIISTVASVLVSPAGLISAVGGLIATFAPLVALLGAGFVAFQALARIVEAIRTNASGAGDAFNALMGTLGQIGAAISAIVSSSLQAFSTILESVGKALFGITGIDFSNVTNFFTRVGAYAQRALDILNNAKDVISFISNALSKVTGGGKSEDSQKAVEAQRQAINEMKNLTGSARQYGQQTGNYLVQQGDSLIGIAKKYNTSVDELIKANGGKRFKLFAGSKINLPIDLDAKAAQDELSRLRTLALNAEDDIRDGGTSVVDAFKNIAGTDIFKKIFGDADLNEVFNKLRGIETKIRDTVDDVTRRVRTLIDQVVASIRGFVTNAVTFINNIVDTLKNSEVGRAISGFIANLPATLQSVGDSLSRVFDGVRSKVTEFFNFSWLSNLGITFTTPDFGPVRDAILEGLKAVLNPSQLIARGGEILRNIADSITGLFSNIHIDEAKLRGVIKERMNLIVGLVFSAMSIAFGGSVTGALAVNAASGLFSAFMTLFLSDFLNIRTNVREFGIVKGLTMFARDLLTYLYDSLTTAIGNLIGGKTGGESNPKAQEAGKQVLTSVFDQIVEGLKGAVSYIASPKFADTIRFLIFGATKTLLDLTADLLTVSFGIGPGGRLVIELVKIAYGALLDALPGLAALIEQSGIGEAVQKAYNSVVGLISQIRDFLVDGIRDLSTNLETVGTSISDGVGGAVTSVVSALAPLQDFGGSIISTVLEKLTELINGFSGFIDELKLIDYNETIKSVVVFIEQIVSIGARIASFAAEFAGSTVISVINRQLPKLGKSLRGFIGALNGLRIGNLATFAKGLSRAAGPLISALRGGLFDAIDAFINSFGRNIDGGAVSGFNTLREIISIFAGAPLEDFERGVSKLFLSFSGIDGAEIRDALILVGGGLAAFFAATNPIVTTIAFVAQGLGQALPYIGEALRAFVEGLAFIKKGLGETGLDRLTDGLGNLAQAVTTFPLVAAENVRNFLELIGADGLVKPIDTLLIPALTELRDGLGGFFEALKGLSFEDIASLALFGVAVAAIANPLAALAGAVGLFVALGIGKALPDIGFAISDFADSLTAFREGDAVGFLDGLKNTFNDLADAIEKLVGAAKEKLTDFGLGPIVDAVDKIANNPLAVGVFNSMVGAIKSYSDVLQNLKGATLPTNLFDGIAGALNTLSAGNFGNLVSAVVKPITGFFDAIAKVADGTLAGKAGTALQELGGKITSFFSGIGGELGKSSALKDVSSFFGKFQGFLDKISLLGAVVANFDTLRDGISGFIENIKGIDLVPLLKLAAVIGVLINPLGALSALAVDLGLALVGGALPGIGKALKDLSDAAKSLFEGDFEGTIDGVVRVVKDLIGAVTDGLLSALDRFAKILTDLTGIDLGKPSESLRQLGTIIQVTLTPVIQSLGRFFNLLLKNIFLSIFESIKGILPRGQEIVDNLTNEIQALGTVDKISDALSRRLAGEKVDISGLTVTANADEIARNIPSETRKLYTDALSKALAEGDTGTSKVLLPIVASPYFPTEAKSQLSADVFHMIEEAVKTGDGDKVQALIPVAAKLGVDITGLVNYGVLSPDNIKQAILTAARSGDKASLDVLMPVAVTLGIDKDPEIVQAQGELKTKATELIQQQVGDVSVDVGKINLQFANFAETLGLTGIDPATFDETAKQAIADQFVKKFNVSDAFATAIVNAFTEGGAEGVAKLDFNALFTNELGNVNLVEASTFNLAGINISDGVIDGLRKGFTDKGADVQAAAQILTSAFTQGVNDQLGIHSPSQWAIDTAGYIIEGLVSGLTAASLLLQPSLQVIIASFDTLRTSGVAALDLLTAKIILLPATVAPAIASANNYVKSMATAWDEVAKKAADAEAAIKRAIIAGGGTIPPLPQVPPQVPSARASGGSMIAGNWYQLEDGQKPEMVRIGNRTYLSPSRNGYVQPVNSAPVNTNNIGGNTFAPTYEINVPPGSNVSADQMYEIAYQAGQQAHEDWRRENSANRRLTNNGVR